jgi:hypothetical protein
VLEGTVIGRLPLCVEAARGKFPRLEVVGNAFATNPLSRTRVIGAIALYEVFFFLAVHPRFPPSKKNQSGIDLLLYLIEMLKKKQKANECYQIR